MFTNFVPGLFRIYSSIYKLGFMQQRGFCIANLFYNQSHKPSSGHRTIPALAGMVNAVSNLGTCNFGTSSSLALIKYGGNLKISINSYSFHKIGTIRFRSGFYTTVVFSSKHSGSWRQFSRNFSSPRNPYQKRNRTTAIYTIALVIVVLGTSYAAVPLYRMFCQASGLGGTVQQADAGEKIKNMTTRKERLLTVRFNADKSATMQWSFKPQQSEVKVYAGETALAFYTAKNPTDFPVTGISTYNVIPFEAGQYFNKIQCFCFEEQRLNPHEQVDMPVFFYIDPEFLEDPALYKVDTITLSYTFFQAKEAQDLGIQ